MPPLDDTGSVPTFDPTKPFDVEGGEKNQRIAPAFDPKQPFSVEEEPKGFVGSTIEAGMAGAKAGTESLSQTGAALKGKTVEPSAPSTLPAAQPITWGDFAHPANLAEKSVYQFAQSWPTLVYGIGGGMAGMAVAGPAGAIAGGALGAGLASTAQAIGPQFAAALKENPSDPDAAFSAAMKHAAVSGAAGAAGWALFGWQPFESTIKNILFQTFGVQQATGAAEKGAANVIEGKPVGEGIAEGIPGTAVGTAIPLVGHAAVTHMMGREAPPQPSSVETATAPIPPEVGSTATITTPRGLLPVTVTGVTPEGIVELAHADGTPDAMTVDEFNRSRVELPAAPPPAEPSFGVRPLNVEPPVIGETPRTAEDIDRQARQEEQAQAGVQPTPEVAQPAQPQPAVPMPEPLPPSAEDIRAEQERQKLLEMAKQAPELEPVQEPVPEPIPEPVPQPIAQPAAPERGELPGEGVPQESPVAQPVPTVAPAEPPQRTPGWEEIGKNYIGQTLYEDERGVRSILQPNGIRTTEPVQMRPTRGGMQIGTDRDNNPEYQLAQPHPTTPNRPIEYQPSTEAPGAAIQVETNPQINLAAALEQRLGDPKPISSRELQQMTEQAYGSKLAEGKFTRAEMYDALELGVNRYVAAHPELFDPHADLPQAKQIVNELSQLKDRLPTQTVRAGEKDRFQQFSTPPDYSYAAAWLADFRNDDRVLEPSAGTGSLVAHASNSRAAQIITNELSENRAPLVESLAKGQDRSFREDAEQLNNILPPDVRPSVVLMNPPFSQTAGRMGDKKVLMTGARHIDQALARLEPGGRLVAIVGRGMTMDAPTFKRWWAEKASNFDVRANMGIPGKVYGKYGTNFATRLLVIDKVPPSGRPVVTGNAESLPDAMERLDAVRQDRPSGPAEQPEGVAGQPVAGQSAGPEMAPTGPGAAGPELPVPGPTLEAGVRPEPTAPGTGGQLPSGVEPGGGRAPGPEAEPGAGHELVPQQPEPGRPEGADLGAQQPPAERPELGGGKPEGNGVAVRPEDESGSVLPPSAEPPGVDESGVHEGPTPEAVTVDEAAATPETGSEITENVYEPYKPQRINIRGATAHPGKLVQSAAMASVMPPKVDYAPRIPKALITTGALSDAQLEAVTYAGHAHSQMLPANEGETPYRRGYFIGDGTGVGKGREVAGIILDNWQQGRQKALWVSESKDLIKDAQRDWGGLGQDAKHVFDLQKTKADGEIKNPNGIVFAPYDTLATGGDKRTSTSAFLKGQEVRTREGDQGVITKTKPVRVSKGTAFYEVKMADGSVKTMPFGDLERAGPEPEIAQSRVDQMVNWLGPDFDGVVAFDESHNMGNSTQTRGKRGVQDAAQKAISAIELQQKLPNARVVYASATGATEVKNLAYAERLGLWGRGTAFTDKLDFISKIGSGGIAAMELVARDMKAMGHYISRNLSYDGVEYDRVEHQLTPEQREVYDQLAEGWQHVLGNIEAALDITAPAGPDGKPQPSPRAISAAKSAFWSSHQRFFNQIITAMQMPSVIRGVERDLGEGKQAVLQLVNTQQASQDRAISRARSEEGDLEDLDMTPRDQLLQMIDKSFPTQQYETFVDENGNERQRPVVDAAGNPVHNPQAVAMKDALISRVSSIRVPDGPLEMLMNHFGVDKVAEVTGRTQRVVRKPDETGQVRAQIEARGANTNVAEANAFQNAKKPILVFSQAGMTGRSYHADNDSPSANSRRSHYLVQAGWRADKAIQGFGRTHRTNQASEPIFHLVTTDLQGQRRFISSIARRLAQLGALTKGERRAGESGMFGARDNLESSEARSALGMLWRDLQDNNVPNIGREDFEKQTGLKLSDKAGNRTEAPEITQFLNRLLSFKFDMQNHVFSEFERRLNDAIDLASSRGTLDVGTETLKGDKISKEEQRVVHTDPQSGAETSYVRLKVENRNHPTTWAQVNRQLGSPPVFYALSKRSGKLYAVSESTSVTDPNTGAVVPQYRLRDQLKWDYTPRDKISGQNAGQYWELIDKNNSRAQALWDKQVAETPEFGARDVHLITGAVLPIWDRLAGVPKVYRLQTDAGERMLGRVVDEAHIDQTLRALGAEEHGLNYAPETVAQRIMQGIRATLANGWTLKRSMVAGEPRIELIGPNFTHEAELGGSGVFTERIGYNQRYFIPTGEQAAPVLARVLERRPVIEMTAPKGEPGLAEEGGRGELGAFRDTMAEFTHPEGTALNQHEAARDYVIAAGERTGNEHVAAYDAATGRIEHVGTGDAEDNIGTFSPEFIKRLADPDATIVLHHNHPRSGALSEADVSLLAAAGLHTITAHGHDGSFSAATLTPAAREFLDRHGFEDQIKILGDMRNVASEKVASRLMDLGMRGQINERNANLIYADLSNRALAAAGLIDYVSSRESPLDKFTTQGIIRQARDAVNMKLGYKYRGQFEAEDSDAARFVRSADTIRPDEGLARVSEEAESDQGAGQSDLEAGNRPGRTGNEEALQRKGRVAEDEEPRSPRDLLADERGGVSIKDQTEAVKAAAKGIEKILSPTTVDKTSQLAEALHRKETGMARGEIERADVRVDPFRAAERKYLKEYQDYLDQPRGPGIVPKGDPALLKVNDFMESRSNNPVYQGPPELKPLADVLRKIYTEGRTAIEREPTVNLHSFIDDYVSHDYVKKGSGAAWGRIKQGAGRFMKERRIPTIREALEEGLTPVDPSLIGTAMKYVDNLYKYRAANRIFGTGLDSKMIQRFAPGKAPEGWTKLNGRLSENIETYGTTPSGGKYKLDRPYITHAYAPDGFARIYNNNIDPGWHSTPMGASIYNAILRSVNAVTSAKLAFPGYHALAMANEGINSGFAKAFGDIPAGDLRAGMKAMGHSVLIAPELKGIHDRGAKLQQQYLKTANFGPDYAKAAELLEKGGGRPIGRGAEYRGSAMDNYFQAFKRGTLKSEVGQTARDLAKSPVSGLFREYGRIMDSVSAPLFDQIIPKLKTGAYFDEMSAWLKNNPTATPEEQMSMSRQMIDSMDDRFGEMIMDNIFWNKRLKQTLQLLATSVGWELGSARALGGGAKDLLSGKWTPRARWFVAFPIVMALTSAVYQYLKTQQGPDELKDIPAPKTGGQTPEGTKEHPIPERAILPGYTKDVLGVWKDVGTSLTKGDLMGAVRGVGQLVGSKQNPAIRLGSEILTGKDWQGHPIALSTDSFWDSFSKYAQHIAMGFAPIPFSQTTYRGTNISSAERFAGIRAAPGYLEDPERSEKLGRVHDLGQDLQTLSSQIRDLERQNRYDETAPLKKKRREIVQQRTQLMHQLPKPQMQQIQP